MEWKYKSKIKSLEKENGHLHKVVDKFKETIGKFIKWICKRFCLIIDLHNCYLINIDSN